MSFRIVAANVACATLLTASYQLAAEAQTTPPPAATPPAAAPVTPPAADAPSRVLPDPLDSPPFPSSTWVPPVIGESADSPVWPLQRALMGKKADTTHLRIYGWFDLGGVGSNSQHSTTPESYSFVPNRLLLDQALLRIESLADTTQTDHVSYGFRLTGLYGVDYRYTVAKGYFSSQLIKGNNLYGADIPESWVQAYFPKVAEGTIVTVGRYISPLDIEAQWAPYNYLYTHSVMFSYDPYTFSGANAEFRLSKQSILHIGIHGGNDVALWTDSTHLNLEVLYGYNTKSNNDSFWGGLDSIGPSGHYENGHDNLQVLGGVWGHKFSRNFHMQTESYYIFQYDAALGGTAIYGPSETYAGGGGPGSIYPGRSYSIGAVNYLEYKLDPKSYASFRSDMLDDANGQRTGVPNHYYSFTAGISRNMTPTLTVRPEIRYDLASSNPYYGEDYVTGTGAKKSQYTIGGDIIQHF